MMTIQVFSTMLLYMLVSSFTPGPGNILALNTMIAHGWKDGKKLLLGIACGYTTIQAVCTFAISGLNEYLSSALQILKYIGVAYLVWLAIHIAFSNQSENLQSEKPCFRTGYVMQLVNVKIYFYITTLLSAYIVPAFPELWEMLLMGVLVVAVGCAATLTWAFLGLKLQRTYQKYFRAINIILGVFLLYCAFSIIRS